MIKRPKMVQTDVLSQEITCSGIFEYGRPVCYSKFVPLRWSFYFDIIIFMLKFNLKKYLIN